MDVDKEDFLKMQSAKDKFIQNIKNIQPSDSKIKN